MGKQKPPLILEKIAITAMSAEGKGIAKVEGKVHFVKGAMPGDVVDAVFYKNKAAFADGFVQQIISPSPDRISAICSHFGLCGGCKWQHINYQTQLAYKQDTVIEALRRIGKVDVTNALPIIGADEPYLYRNKLDFGFTDRRWLTNEELAEGKDFDRDGVGFHVAESFAGIIDVHQCHLQSQLSDDIRNSVRAYAKEEKISFFDLKRQTGFLRTLMVRTATTGEVLVLLSVAENDVPKAEEIMAFLGDKFPAITSLQYVINLKKNDTIYDLTPVVYKGPAFILEKLGGNKFMIGAKSFFQTNTKQAEKLYKIAKDFARLEPTHNVYDLYTGVGSIAMYVADRCKSVTGIEQIEEAIVDAKLNAQLNDITNCTFYAGDVRMVLNQDFIAKQGKPDVVITDPPRNGMHTDVIDTLLALESPRIVYVSCNVATQARDIELLSAKYEVAEIQAVDMFPQTTHIENVVRLELKK